jgi:hypothetical protein
MSPASSSSILAAVTSTNGIVSASTTTAWMPSPAAACSTWPRIASALLK